MTLTELRYIIAIAREFDISVAPQKPALSASLP